MAVLSDTERQRLWAEFMREDREAIPILKPALRAIVDELDARINAALTNINSAMTSPGWDSLSAMQKRHLFLRNIERRFRAGV